MKDVAVKGCFSPFAVGRCIAGQSSRRNAAGLSPEAQLLLVLFMPRRHYTIAVAAPRPVIKQTRHL